MNCVGCSIVWGNGSLEIHQQTEAGENVDTIPDLREFAPDKHHERYDGKGYPEGKSGEDIPFIARMICAADSYDAMNTDRVYRKNFRRKALLRNWKKGREHSLIRKLRMLCYTSFKMINLILIDKRPVNLVIEV